MMMMIVIMIIIVIVIIMILMMMMMIKSFDNKKNRIIITERGTCKELISVRGRQFKAQGRVFGRGRKTNKQFTQYSENKQ